MRILYVSHTHPPENAILDNEGGMQRVSLQLINELHRCNDVSVHAETVNVSGRGWVALKTTGFLLKTLVSLAVKARTFDADIILFSSMVTASLAWPLRRYINIPMVTINHGRDVTLDVNLYQRMVPHIFDALDGVISVSRATGEESKKRGMQPKKGIVLPNGFKLETMNNLPTKKHAKTALQANFNIPDNNKAMLLTVGRQVKRKGHEWFIREVLPQVDKEIIYLIVGNGPEFANIEKAANQSGQQDNIYLLGRQPDKILKQAYVAADVFIMPNIPVKGDMEGFGIVLLEANMAKTPAVATDLEGIKDVIATGENGWKVPVLDAKKFAAAINNLLSQNLEKYAEQSRRYIKNKFTWQQVARRYVIYLNEVLKDYNQNHSKN